MIQYLINETKTPTNPDNPKIKYRPRQFQVYVDKEGMIHISTYLLGPRGARVIGGTAITSREELARIVEAVNDNDIANREGFGDEFIKEETKGAQS